MWHSAGKLSRAGHTVFTTKMSLKMSQFPVWAILPRSIIHDNTYHDIFSFLKRFSYLIVSIGSEEFQLLAATGKSVRSASSRKYSNIWQHFPTIQIFDNISQYWSTGRGITRDMKKEINIEFIYDQHNSCSLVC